MTKHDILRRYTRIGLVFPLLIPALLFGLTWLLQGLGIDPEQLFPGWLVWTGIILMASLLFGGIPYLAFYPLAWYASGRFTRNQTYVFLLLTPVVFYVLQFTGLFMYVLVEYTGHTNSVRFWSSAKDVARISLMVFPVAYGYIALILMSYHIRIRFFQHT